VQPETRQSWLFTAFIALVGGIILLALAYAPAGPVFGAGALRTASIAFIAGIILTIAGLLTLLIIYLKTRP